eukprot:2290750-Pleurochrysis_carterae.AAC.2
MTLQSPSRPRLSEPRLQRTGLVPDVRVVSISDAPRKEPVWSATNLLAAKACAYLHSCITDKILVYTIPAKSTLKLTHR